MKLTLFFDFSSNPESVQTVDNNGFLPLHWAVSVDQPNIETVRKLLALYPAGATAFTRAESTGSDSRRGGGLLPLHLCVDRENPSLAIIRALLDVCPEAARTPSSGAQGALPLHFCVNRERPHFETVALLVAHYPESVSSVNSSNQTPMHRWTRFIASLSRHAIILFIIMQAPRAAAATKRRSFRSGSKFPTRQGSVGPSS